MKKISVVINKNWETEPIINALTNTEIRPANLIFPQTVNSPKDRSYKSNSPRVEYQLSDIQVKIWCIQDLMYFGVPANGKPQSSSSSEEKYRVLPPILTAENPDLVIAVGTAGHPSAQNLNGSVIIGSNFFVYNGHSGNPSSNLIHNDIGKVLYSNVNPKIFDTINSDFKNITEPKFLKTPRNPSLTTVCMASKAFTAVSSINVTDYTEYNWVDHEAVQKFEEVEKRLPINSLETTHGVIKFSTDKPIIFMSAITDMLGHFDTEVTPSQNYTASFNAGIVLGQLLCSLNDFAKINSF